MVSLAAFILGTLAGGGVVFWLSRRALNRFALFLGLLAFAALLLTQTAHGDFLPSATNPAWWAMFGFALGFTAASLFRSLRSLFGRL